MLSVDKTLMYIVCSDVLLNLNCKQTQLINYNMNHTIK